ncbi:MAG: hypothetical protein AB7Q17_02590 [Phycisphaerae bacterium]
MDAARFAWVAAPLLWISAGGCALLNPPATHHAPEPPEDDSSQIVQQASPKSATARTSAAADVPAEQSDPLDAQIAAYLERMEAAERPGSRRADAPRAGERDGGLRLATDERLVPGTPAAPNAAGAAVAPPPAVTDFGARSATGRRELDAVPLGPRSTLPDAARTDQAAGNAARGAASESGVSDDAGASGGAGAPHAARTRDAGASAASGSGANASSAASRGAGGSEPVPASAAQKPTLTALTARPAASIVEPARGEAAAPAGVNTPVAARGVPASLQEFVGQWLATSDDGSFRHQLDARVMQVLAGEYERAREPLNLVTKEQQETASRFIDALVAIREGNLGDPSGAARSVLRELDALATTLRQVSELSVSTPVFCREVRGFGQYTPIEPAQFRGGAEFVIYVELRDFASTREPDGVFVSRFDLRTTVLSQNGESVLELRDDAIVDRCRNQRKDCFLPKLVRLPATLAPGEYVARVSVLDKVGEKAAEQQAAFRVLAR